MDRAGSKHQWRSENRWVGSDSGGPATDLAKTGKAESGLPAIARSLGLWCG